MENRTVYSGCYEFLGESTLKFETPPDVPIQKASAPRVQTALSAGLRFSLALAEDIHVATAAAGDVVKAVLTTDLRDRANKVVVRKHTPVLCRIVRIRRHYYGNSGCRRRYTAWNCCSGWRTSRRPKVIGPFSRSWTRGPEL